MTEYLKLAKHIGQVFSNRRFDMDSSVIPNHLFDEWGMSEQDMLPKKSCGMFVVVHPDDYANHAVGDYDIINISNEAVELLNTEPDNAEGWGEEVTNQELLRMNQSVPSGVKNHQHTIIHRTQSSQQSSEVGSMSYNRLKESIECHKECVRRRKNAKARNSKANSGKRNKNARRSLKDFGLPED